MNHGSSSSIRMSRSAAMILLLILAPSTVFAESHLPGDGEDVASPDRVVDTEIKVTWQDVVELVRRHPQIGAGRHRIAAARAAVDAAGAVPNPGLEATGAYGQAIDNSASRIEWGLALSIPLGWIAQRGARIDGARAGETLAVAEVKALRRDVFLQLRVMFWALVYEQERVKSLVELDEEMSALAMIVSRRVEKGEVRPVEAARVEVEAEKAAGELEVARLSLEASSDSLATWLGVRKGERLVAAASLKQIPRLITQELARKKAGEHPRMDAAKARVQALAANVTVERRARVPSIAVEVFTDHELDRRAVGIGLAIDLPLWNWNTGNIRRSEHMLAVEKKNRATERLELETLAIEAQAMCEAGIVIATRYKERILPRAESAARTIERTYQLGEATLLEVIDSRRTLLETRRQFLSTLSKAQIDCSRLHAITEEELP